MTYKINSLTLENEDKQTIVIFINDDNECKIEITNYVKLDIKDLTYIMQQTLFFIDNCRVVEKKSFLDKIFTFYNILFAYK